ncbi:GtrA family protein [Bacillus manliponensis]
MLVDKFFINKFLSQIFSIGVGLVMNFFLNKLWVFNKQSHFH